MGAGPSLPEQVDKATARSLAGERFDEGKFDALADAKGFVSRAAFLEAGGVQQVPQPMSVKEKVQVLQTQLGIASGLPHSPKP